MKILSSVENNAFQFTFVPKLQILPNAKYRECKEFIFEVAAGKRFTAFVRWSIRLINVFKVLPAPTSTKICGSSFKIVLVASLKRTGLLIWFIKYSADMLWPIFIISPFRVEAILIFAGLNVTFFATS